MTTTLHRLFPVNHLAALDNPPDREIAGLVFVLPHWDSMERYDFWSVNFQSASGDSGWQSSRIYSPQEADAAAQVLAEWKAEVVWP